MSEFHKSSDRSKPRTRAVDRTADLSAVRVIFLLSLQVVLNKRTISFESMCMELKRTGAYNVRSVGKYVALVVEGDKVVLMGSPYI